MTAEAEVRLTNLDKVLWPATGFTKGNLVEYYRRVAPALLPHLRGRPVTLARFPDGVAAKGWYQTNCRGNPAWVATQELRGRDGSLLRYCVVNDLRTLLWVANQATIELHPLHQRVDEPDRAPAIVFDLDPGEPATILDCCLVALDLRAALEARGLRSFPKTSGFRGLHLLVPLNGEASHAQAKAFARSVGMSLAARNPDRVTASISRSARAGRVLVDWAQNDRNRSTIAPYSLRAVSSPAVSTPLRWKEVDAATDPGALRFEPEEVIRRLERFGEVFSPVETRRQSIDGR